MTNNEMLMAAIEFEEQDFACDLYYLIAHGIINGEDEFTLQGSDWNKVDRAISGEYIKNNILGFDIINLYGIRINVTDWHLFFSRNDSEARGYALNKLGTTNFIKFPKEKKLTSFYFPDSKQYKSLLELSKESNVIPRYALTV